MIEVIPTETHPHAQFQRFRPDGHTRPRDVREVAAAAATAAAAAARAHEGDVLADQELDHDRPAWASNPAPAASSAQAVTSSSSCVPRTARARTAAASVSSEINLELILPNRYSRMNSPGARTRPEPFSSAYADHDGSRRAASAFRGCCPCDERASALSRLSTRRKYTVSKRE